MRIITLVATACVSLVKPAMAQFPAPQDHEIVSGHCNSQSHTSEGPVGSDLTKRQSRFFCDTAIVTFFPNDRHHVMITFAQKGDHRPSMLAFAGVMDDAGINVLVDKVYMTPSIPTLVDDGVCKFFFKGRHLSGLMCGTKVDQDGRRTVDIVSFDADPGQ